MGSWRGNSTASYSTANGAENWGAVRLEGDDDLSLSATNHVRSLGMGIEGGPGVSTAGGSTLSPASPTTKGMRRSSGMSWSSSRATVIGSPTGIGSGKARQVSESTTIGGGGAPSEFQDEDRRDTQMLTTLSLLQTFHAHTSFQLSVLESFIPRGVSSATESTVYLTPKDVQAFELGPLSGFDAKYVEWLAQEYASGVKVVVKRGWKDLISVVFGYG